MKRLILIFIIALLLVYLIMLTNDYMKDDTIYALEKESFVSTNTTDQMSAKNVEKTSSDASTIPNLSENVTNVNHSEANNQMVYFTGSKNPNQYAVTHPGSISPHVGVSDDSVNRMNLLNELTTGISTGLGTSLRTNIMSSSSVESSDIGFSETGSADTMSTNSSASSDISMIVTNNPPNASKPENSGKLCAPVEKKCSADKCGLDNLHPILDPRFNMRETAKQCLLLEDHLNNIKKRCFDCIRKHFLTIDGFLEEAVSLEQDNQQRDYYRQLYIDWLKLEKQYAKNPRNSDNLDNISKNIRIFRKPLLEKYFDTVSEYDE